MCAVPQTTEAEYLALSARAEERMELYNGAIVAMSGASEAHALVAMNLGAALHARLRGSPCRAYTNDLRVHVEATGAWVYPDVTVVCGPTARTEGNPPSVRNPRLVIEVLSPSTALHDRGAKAAHYRRIPSLAGYLLVDIEARRVELTFRGDDGDWRLREAEGLGTLHIPDPALVLPLAELWEGLDSIAPE